MEDVEIRSQALDLTSVREPGAIRVLALIDGHNGEARDDHWYLAQLRPGGLARARLNLERQGFATFMPMRKVHERRGSRFRVVSRPLFPGYLFVQVLPEQRNWRSINATYGVARLVALEAATPTRVPRGLISALRKGQDPRSMSSSPERLKAGARVRITGGPFARTLAAIETVDPAGRIQILMQLMGQVVRAAVRPSDLEAL